MMMSANAPIVIINQLLGPFLRQYEKSSVCAPADTVRAEATIPAERIALIFLNIMLSSLSIILWIVTIDVKRLFFIHNAVLRTNLFQTPNMHVQRGRA